jgi:hypothetical protein
MPRAKKGKKGKGQDDSEAPEVVSKASEEGSTSENVNEDSPQGVSEVADLPQGDQTVEPVQADKTAVVEKNITQDAKDAASSSLAESQDDQGSKSKNDDVKASSTEESSKQGSSTVGSTNVDQVDTNTGADATLPVAADAEDKQETQQAPEMKAQTEENSSKDTTSDQGMSKPNAQDTIISEQTSQAAQARAEDTQKQPEHDIENSAALDVPQTATSKTAGDKDTLRVEASDSKPDRDDEKLIKGITPSQGTHGDADERSATATQDEKHGTAASSTSASSVAVGEVKPVETRLEETNGHVHGENDDDEFINDDLEDEYASSHHEDEAASHAHQHTNGIHTRASHEGEAEQSYDVQEIIMPGGDDVELTNDDDDVRWQEMLRQPMGRFDAVLSALGEVPPDDFGVNNKANGRHRHDEQDAYYENEDENVGDKTFSEGEDADADPSFVEERDGKKNMSAEEDADAEHQRTSKKAGGGKKKKQENGAREEGGDDDDGSESSPDEDEKKKKKKSKKKRAGGDGGEVKNGSVAAVSYLDLNKDVPKTDEKYDVCVYIYMCVCLCVCICMAVWLRFRTLI